MSINAISLCDRHRQLYQLQTLHKSLDEIGWQLQFGQESFQLRALDGWLTDRPTWMTVPLWAWWQSLRGNLELAHVASGCKWTAVTSLGFPTMISSHPIAWLALHHHHPLDHDSIWIYKRFIIVVVICTLYTAATYTAGPGVRPCACTTLWLCNLDFPVDCFVLCVITSLMVTFPQYTRFHCFVVLFCFFWLLCTTPHPIPLLAIHPISNGILGCLDCPLVADNAVTGLSYVPGVRECVINIDCTHHFINGPLQSDTLVN